MAVGDKVKSIIVEQLGVDEEEVTPDASFVDDLGDDSQFATRIAGEVKHFDPLRFLEKKDVKKMDIFIQYAIAASQFAMDDAQLAIEADLAPRAGVFIASGIGGFSTIEREHKALLE